MDQHTVTGSYLAAFCDPGLSRPSVWVVDLRQNKIRCAAPRNVATEIDYYSRTLPDGTLGDGVEKVLARVETEAAPIIKKLRAGAFSLTGDDRGILAIFASAARAGSVSRPSSLWRPTKCAWMFGRRPGAPCSDTANTSVPWKASLQDTTRLYPSPGDCLGS